jgi:UDP-N-acetylmuramoyl-L-alanyl-D-glutamate--2,6-diaminopimelate ligase
VGAGAGRRAAAALGARDRRARAVAQSRPHRRSLVREPSAALAVAGVTGTNGKTSCTHFVAQAASALGRRCGVSGTVGAGFPGALEPAALTTPDALAVHRTLARLRGQGARAVAMEVSSHALDQGRVDGVRFDVAALTNLSRDHLDYHGDMGAYAAAKTRLFREHAPRAAVLNCGDALGRALVPRVADATALVLVAPQDPVPPRAQWLAASSVESDGDGLRVAVTGSVGRCELRTRLLGAFNADNLLVSLGVLLCWGSDLDAAARALSGVSAPPGRMERFGDAADGRSSSSTTRTAPTRSRRRSRRRAPTAAASCGASSAAAGSAIRASVP